MALLFIYLCIYLFICLFIYLFIHSFIHPSIHPSIHSSTHSFIHSFIYFIFIYLFALLTLLLTSIWKRNLKQQKSLISFWAWFKINFGGPTYIYTWNPKTEKCKNVHTICSNFRHRVWKRTTILFRGATAMGSHAAANKTVGLHTTCFAA